MWPILNVSKADIVIMTVDKFINSASTPIKSYKKLYAEELFGKDCKCVCYFDEYDNIFTTIKKAIKREASGWDSDAISMFSTICNNLKKTNFSTLLKGFENESFYSHGGLMTYKERIELLISDSQKIFNKYKMENRFKTDERVEADIRNPFLFKLANTVYYNKNNQLIVRLGTNVNTISIKTEDINSETDNIKYLDHLAEDIYKFISRDMMEVIYRIATKYTEKIYQEGNYIEYNDACKSVLNYMYLDTYKDFFMKYIFNYKYTDEEQKMNYLDKGFYQEGFYIATIKDSYTNKANTHLIFHVCKETPEKILSYVAERALVIGISATANLGTALHNFNNNYIRVRLGTKYIELSKEDKQKYKRYIENSNDYSGVLLDTNDFILTYKDNNNELCEINTSKNEWEMSFTEYLRSLLADSEYNEKKEYIRKLIDKINGIVKECKNLTNKDNDFVRDRYLKILWTYIKFALDKSHEGGLCLTTANAKELNEEKSTEFSFEFINECKVIIDEYLGINSTEILIKPLRNSESKSFEDTRKEIDEIFSNGKRIFVLASYLAAGFGFNPQHITSRDINELVRIRNYGKDEIDKVDYSFIALIKPTSIVENTYRVMRDPEVLLDFIYDLESLRYYGDISESQEAKCIKEIFSIKDNESDENSKYINGIMSSTESVKESILMYLIQGIGRICRTEYRNKIVSIALDKEFAETLSNIDINKYVLSKESFSALENINKYSQKKKENSNKSPENRFERLLERQSDALNKYIKGKLLVRDDTGRFLYTDEWQMIRTEILKPAPKTDEDYANLTHVMRYFYSKCPKNICKYSYNESNDFETTNISLDDSKKLRFEVSKEYGYFDLYEQIKPLKKYFDEQGWTFDIKTLEGEYIENPVAFRNLHVAALSEAAGGFMLEKFFNIKTEPLPMEHFELFDSKADIPGVYIDYKNWRADRVPREIKDVITTKVIEKANSVSAKTIIYIQPVINTEMKVDRLSKEVVKNNFPHIFEENKELKPVNIVTIPGLIIVKKGVVDINREAVACIERIKREGF